MRLFAFKRIFFFGFCFLFCFCFSVWASRNIGCLALVTVKVLSSHEYVAKVKVSPTETEVINSIDLEVEINSVDSVMACEYRIGQKIKLTISRDDNYKYNRVKKNALIKPGTVLKGSIDHLADENGDLGYCFENISDVLN